MKGKLYSIREAAELLGISRAYVYNLKDMGRIKVEKIGAQYVISQEEIDRYKNNHKGGAGNAK